MPRIPFAPRLLTSSSDGPIALQAAGTGTELASTTSIGTEGAVWFERVTSAVTTGPHSTLSTNCPHSKTALDPDVCLGRLPLKVPRLDARSRSPNEPVSTRTFGML